VTEECEEMSIVAGTKKALGAPDWWSVCGHQAGLDPGAVPESWEISPPRQVQWLNLWPLRWLERANRPYFKTFY